MMRVLASYWVLFLATGAQAHIAVTWPPPFYAQYNPNTVAADTDYTITAPLASDGSNFPCKGKDNGAPLGPNDAGGQSQASWSQGQAANFTTGSGAIHSGGSCQAALSFDGGKTFSVVHSYIGNCPAAANEKFDFTIPSDSPTGSAIFFWLWYNAVGNREIYADCSAVTITAGSGSAANSSKRDAPAVAFKDRPSIFLANLNNGCQTVESKNIEFPDPGPDVTRDGAAQTGTFTGTCNAVKGVVNGGGSSGNSTTRTGNSTASSVASGSSSLSSTMSSPASGGVASSATGTFSAGSGDAAGSSSGQCLGSCLGGGSSSGTSEALGSGSNKSGSASGSSVVSSPHAGSSSSQLPSNSSMTSMPPRPTSSSSAANTSSSLSSTAGPSINKLITSPDGSCSIKRYTCNGSSAGPCCSKWGFCGSMDAYCGAGCQSGFGTCGPVSSNSSATASLASMPASSLSRGPYTNSSSPVTRATSVGAHTSTVSGRVTPSAESTPAKTSIVSITASVAVSPAAVVPVTVQRALASGFLTLTRR